MPLENIERKEKTQSAVPTSPDRKEDLSEIKEVSGRVVETVPGGDLEDVEAMGHVSEKARERTGEDASSGSSTQAKKSAKTVAQVKAELLKNLPSETEMIRQVEHEIRKEIAMLHKKAVKMARSPKNYSYFEMANVLRKIRELKGILSTLVKASLEGLKALWLRFVHGISS